MSETTTNQSIEQFRDATEAVWNRGEFDTLTDVFADDVAVHDVPTGETYDGRDEFEAWIRGIRGGFPDFELDSEASAFYATEDRIMSQWRFTGTHDGTLPGIGAEPTGRPIELVGATFYELEDGTVTEAWWYYDMLSLLEQLGLAPAELST